jgi:crotonobetainyl-CoA:carnitine CoA-transferase CaiB-like acyl-CoA transferase
MPYGLEGIRVLDLTNVLAGRSAATSWRIWAPR